MNVNTNPELLNILEEELLRKAIPAMIFVVELPSRKIKYINRDPLEFSGFSDSEINNISAEERLRLLDPDDAKELNKHYKRIMTLADHEETSFEYKSKNKQQEWIWFKVTGNVFRRDKNGAVTHGLNVAVDITANKRAEQEISQSRELLQANMDSSPGMIQVFKAIRNEEKDIIDFTWILINNASKKMYGDVIGKRLRENNPGVVEEGIFDSFKKVVETGVSQQYEKHYAHEQFDGWFLQSVVKLDDGVATTTIDITEQKRAQQELQESKTLLKDIIDAPNIGIAVYKAVYDDDRTVVDFLHEYVNRASLDMLDDDYTGRLLSDHGENGMAQLQLFRDAIATGKRNAYTRYVNFRGCKAWFSITNTPLDRERLVHTWEDISERKRAEEEILRLRDEIAQKATDKYYSIFNSIDEGLCIYELIYEKGKVIDLLWLEVNPAYEKHTGLKDVVGKQHSDLSQNTESYWFDIYGKVVETGESVHFENWHESTGRWYHTFISRIGGAESHQVAVVFADITERKLNERRQEFLLKLTDALRTIADPACIQYEAARILGEQLGAQRVAYSHIDHEHHVIERDWTNGAYSFAGRHLMTLYPKTVYRDLIAGKNSMSADVQADPDFSTEEAAMCAAMDIKAFASFPLMKQDKLTVVFIITYDKPHRWSTDEIQLATETAERTWSAVERAKAEQARLKSEKDLKELNDNLEQQVQKRTKELTKLKINQEKEKLGAIIFAQEQERQRISEGLHDGVAQLLYAAQMRLQVETSDEAVDKELQTANAILLEAIQELRKVSFELMPPVLRDHGLKTSIEALIDRVVGKSFHLTYHVARLGRLSEQLEITIYRIVQESLNNILKHASATEASVSITVDKSYVNLKVSDNGVGFVYKKSKMKSSGIGLQSIYNRVKLLNGKIKILTAPGQGTLIELKLPVMQER